MERLRLFKFNEKGIAWFTGHCLAVMRGLPSECIQAVVTSPPYWGLRSYSTVPQIWGGQENCKHEWEKGRRISDGNAPSNKTGLKSGLDKMRKQPVETTTGDTCGKCGAWKGELGNEPTPKLYIEHLCKVFSEVNRILKPDGVFFLNLGDSYNSVAGNYRGLEQGMKKSDSKVTLQGGIERLKNKSYRYDGRRKTIKGLAPKNLIGIPWRAAFALQESGWILRSECIWCLSGGTNIYIRSQKGDMVMTLKDAARLNPTTCKLWNGKKWVQVLGWKKTPRTNEGGLELVLRSGERIACTQNHKFPTSRGLLKASDIKVGDRLKRVKLPEPNNAKKPKHIDNDIAWFIGLYIAEGSPLDDSYCISFSGHIKEVSRWERLQRIAKHFGGGAKLYHLKGKSQRIHVFSRILKAILQEFVSGRTQKDRCLSSRVWNYSNEFLKQILLGYLEGDGGWDESNNRWRLGFMRNYNLERDIRTLAARLDVPKLKMVPKFNVLLGKKFPTFSGELRFEVSKHWNCKDNNEVVKISQAKFRNVYDVAVEGKPHLFALASGILTHNSKSNAMPESVKDRPNRDHEHIFMFVKQPKYYFDMDAVRMPVSAATRERDKYTRITNGKDGQYAVAHNHETPSNELGRNLRTVWDIPTRPFRESHFAVYPPALPERCIKMASKPGDIILDPFGGSGCTAYVAAKLGRRCISIELNPNGQAMAARRAGKIAKGFFGNYDITDK